MNNIVPFQFHSDTLDVVRTESGDVAVPLRKLCEVLGIDFSSQLAKLKSAPWACMVIITTQLPGDNQRREIVCLDRRSIPMWAASINANKVDVDIRPKLIHYQRECADVLADHFLGKRGAPAQTALEAAEIFSQQATLVRDDPNLHHLVQRAIRRACNATKRSWASVEAMIRRSTRAQGWTLISALNAPRAIALLEAVEEGIVVVPTKRPKLRAVPNNVRQLPLGFRKE